ncbi:MAG: ATP-binding protein [Gammaproteobacteria bacterium]|nr:ATP-binding protein [Gammaproteobacteria bacterium]
MKSIQTRLNSGLGLSLIVVFVLLGIGVSVSFRILAEGYMLSRLEHDAESLLASLVLRSPQRDRPRDRPQDHGEREPELRADRLNPVYQRVFSGHYYRIDIDGQVLRSRSLWDQDLNVPAVGVGTSAHLRQTGPEGQLLLMHVARYRKAGADVRIAVAEDLSPIRVEVRRFQWRYALFGIVALVLLLLLQRAILRRGLAPLSTAAQELVELERGERTQLRDSVPREVQPLVRQINRLLATLHQRLQRSRNAMGNLAHALKTPLTLLGQIADREDNFRDAVHAAQARDLVEKIRTLTERELKRARLAGAAAPGGRMQLASEIEALSAVLRQLYRDRAIRIDIDIPADLHLAADREDMHELFGNLLDNACKWARSRVRVHAEPHGTGIRATIEDDGPGRDAEELERLNLRGVRVDEDATPGYGLGLAIVQDVLDHYGGTLKLGRSTELGGFRAEVVLGGCCIAGGNVLDGN